MKQVFWAFLLSGSFAHAENTTKTALFTTRVSVSPQKAATLAAFQILYASIAFIPAALVALAVKRHAAENSGKGVMGEASAGLVFATVAGTILGASSGVTLAQALGNFADATASAIWNPDDVVVVKTPISVKQSP